MSDLLQLSIQIFLCLIIAAIIGFIIGYLFGRIKKCEEKKNVPYYAENEEPTVVQAFQDKGEKPNMLLAPKNGQADNLKEIKGIGPKIENILNELGIYHFEQIASWTPENAKWIDNFLAFKGRVEREQWISQAEILSKGEATEFSKRVKKDDIYSEKK